MNQSKTEEQIDLMVLNRTIDIAKRVAAITGYPLSREHYKHLQVLNASILKDAIGEFRMDVTRTFVQSGVVKDRFERIFHLTCNEFGVTTERVMSRTRENDPQMARHVIRWLLNSKYSGVAISYPAIAYLTSGKGDTNHSAVSNSIKVVNDLMETDGKILKVIEGIIEKLTMTP